MNLIAMMSPSDLDALSQIIENAVEKVLLRYNLVELKPVEIKPESNLIDPEPWRCTSVNKIGVRCMLSQHRDVLHQAYVSTGQGPMELEKWA